MDFLKELGGLGLELRFKRLTKALREEADRVYRHYGFDFQEKWCPVFLLLRKQGPLAITEISRKLGSSHASVLKITRPMNEAGLLVIHKDRLDGRKRLLKLTLKAEKLAPQLEELCQRLNDAQLALFRVAQCDVMPILDRVEAALEREDLSQRAIAGPESSVSSA